jgi:hypothetical protein
MTAPAPKKDLTASSATPPRPPAPRAEPPGWDPFEVWRTRVLLPRLHESDEPAKPLATVQPLRR